MKRALHATAIVLLAVAFAGCGGDGKLRPEGRLLKGGKEFVPEEGQFVAVTFVPVVAPGKYAKNYYYADVDQEAGTFTAVGPDLKGIPPGKYRVAVELMQKKQDLWDGKFDAVNSPFVFEIENAREEVVIDLDEIPTGKTS